MKLVMYFFCFLSLPLFSQTSEENLTMEAQKMAKYIESYDYDGYVSAFYPAVVELAGGEASFKDRYKSYREAYKIAGWITKSVAFVEHSKTVVAGTELHATVKLEAITQLGENTFSGYQYLLGISNDEGNTWKFVDLEGHDAQSIKDFVPNYNAELAFPEMEGATMLETKK